jgi:hypothetical protein
MNFLPFREKHFKHFIAFNYLYLLVSKFYT